jgi:hypothetical protein
MTVELNGFGRKRQLPNPAIRSVPGGTEENHEEPVSNWVQTEHIVYASGALPLR